MTQMTVQVFEIGGQYMIDGGDISGLVVEGSWENVIDSSLGNSVANVTLARCGDTKLDVITPYLHELRISLDGDIVFDGPIFYYAAEVGSGARIVAYDMSAWFSWRWVRDIFDYSTGVDVATFIKLIVKSAIQGGPAWPDCDQMNLMDYLNVEAIPKVINRQNGSLIHRVPFVGTTTYAQGDRPLTDPNEILWDGYLSFLVGKLVHMSCHGRRVNFWPYGKSLEQLAPADISDFTDFPNLVRDGARFTTAAVCQVATDSVTMGDPVLPTNASEGAKTGFSTFNVLSDAAGFAVQIPFYVGQILSADTSLAMPIGTEYLSTQHFGGFPGSTQPTQDVTIDRQFIGPISAGGRISGEVFGHAGGKHPDWPVLVERTRSEQTVVGRAQAAIIAASMIRTEVPFDSLDVDVFKIVLPVDGGPWRFAEIVPGYTTLVTTRLGSINLQVASTNGSWSTSGSNVSKLELSVGLRALPVIPGELPENPKPFVDYTANDIDPSAGDLISVHLDRGAHRRRRIVGDQDDMAVPLFINAPGLPDAIFFPPNTLVTLSSTPDEAAFLAAYPGAAHAVATLTPTQYNLLILACQTGYSG